MINTSTYVSHVWVVDRNITEIRSDGATVLRQVYVLQGSQGTRVISGATPLQMRLSVTTLNQACHLLLNKICMHQFEIKLTFNHVHVSRGKVIKQ